MKKLPIQTKPTRLWFMSQGCKQVPLEYSRNIVRWIHPDGYFLSARGQKIKDSFPPSQYVHKGGSCYPRLVDCMNACHILVAYAIYGERPTYVNDKGVVKPYQAHHLNCDKFDYRPANILAWLHPAVHRIADDRQTLLKTIVPEGDLRGFDYDILREMQDPRTMTQDEFDRRMEYLRIMHECDFDPRIFSRAQLHEIFSQDFDTFKAMLLHHKDGEV